MEVKEKNILKWKNCIESEKNIEKKGKYIEI